MLHPTGPPQFGFRKTHGLPGTLPEPAPAWIAPYAAMALKAQCFAYDSGGGTRVQLRDYTGAMITSDGVSLVRDAGGGQGGRTAFYIFPSNNSSRHGPMRIGDVVSIFSVVTAKYLARIGSAGVGWTSTLNDDARWIIETKNASYFTTGTPIVPERTPFHLVSYSSGKRLKSQGTLVLKSGAGGSSEWTTSLSCHAGDNCGR